MRKFWFLLLATMVAAGGVTSCGDDDDDTIVDENTADDDDATGVDDDDDATGADDDDDATGADDDDDATGADDDDDATGADDDDDATGADDDDDDDDDTGADDDDDTGADDDDDTGDDDDDDGCLPLDTACGASEINVSGVCVPNPDTVATVLGGTAAPALGCYDDPGAASEGPETAQLISCLNVFGLPDNTDGCEVEIFYAVNGNAGESIGKATAAAVDGAVCENKGQVTIDNVPTNTHLLFKASCDGFRDTWQFNQYIPASAVVDGKADSPSFSSNIIAETTWVLIPSLAGSDGVARGNCAIAGQVQDCEENPIANATIELFGGQQNRELVSYFAGERPDPNRTATDASATYAIADAVGAEGGKLHRVAAAVKLDSGVAPAGAFDVSCYPDSVTIITLDGYEPGLNAVCAE